MRRQFCLLMLLLCFTSLSAQNALAIPAGANEVTVAGNTWLSPIYTYSLSYNQVKNLLDQAGSGYEEYRFATIAEVDALATYYGFIVGSAGDHKTTISGVTADEAVKAAQADFGQGYYDGYGYFLTGYADRPDEYGGAYYGSAYFRDGVSVSDGYNNQSYTTNRDYTRFYYGSWLVLEESSAPVPEPSSMLLFGIGLSGLVYRMKKK